MLSGRLRLVPALVGSLIACAAAVLPELAAFEIPAAQASVSVQVPLTYLARTANRVVVGTAMESHSLWEDDAGGARRIVTYHRVRVERQEADGPTTDVWVRCMGGSVDGIGQRVEGEATLRTGTKAMLFLASRQDGTFSVLGLAQGMYPVRPGIDGVERLAAPKSPGVILPGNRVIAAVALLPGKTVDEGLALIREARRSDAK